ncbi:MAG TPA: hypothetical protein VMM35_13180 [Longimicrobiales bacterium]|nr:hypothetical protein [Longimicrobiales bacterium]
MNRKPALIGVGALGIFAWWGAPTPFWQGMVVGVFAVLVVAVVGISYFVRRMRSRASAAMEAPPIPSEAEPWDYAMSANDLDGSPVDFSRHCGRVLILNRWATWYAPCNAPRSPVRRPRAPARGGSRARRAGLVWLGVALGACGGEPTGTVTTMDSAGVRITVNRDLGAPRTGRGAGGRRST